MVEIGLLVPRVYSYMACALTAESNLLIYTAFPEALDKTRTGQAQSRHERSDGLHPAHEICKFTD